MGRTVVGDENRLEAQVDSIFRTGCAVQVGVLIGKLGNGGSRDLIYTLIPTPMKDGEEVATLGSSGIPQKSSKGKPSSDGGPINVSTDWVAEHARQVSRMLLGGMHVVGIYAFCSEGSFKKSLSTLWQALMVVAEVAAPRFDGRETSENLLLHISSSPRKLSCRSCSKGANFSTTALQPCTWKVGKLLNNLQEFSCTFTVDIRYPVQIDYSESTIKGLRGDLSSAIASEATRLQTAHAIVDGSLVQPEKLLGSGSAAHAVQLLLPFDGGAQAICQGYVNVAGNVVVKGEVHARAYAVLREPISHAIADLKEDIVASLRSRVELLVDEADEAEADQTVDDMKSKNENHVEVSRSDTVLVDRLSTDVLEHSFVMPRRVFVPWLEGAMVSDYMLPGESFEDVQERAMDLFGVQEKVDPSTIIEPEILGTTAAVTHHSESLSKDKDLDGSIEREDSGSAVSTSTQPRTYILAAVVLVIALLFSIILMSQ